MSNLKEYAVKALVNTVDHLGSISFKVSSLIDQRFGEVADANLRVSCIQQVLKATHPGTCISPIISLSLWIGFNKVVGFRELKLAKPAWTEKAFHSNPWWSLPLTITRDTSCQVKKYRYPHFSAHSESKRWFIIYFGEVFQFHFANFSWKPVNAQCRAQLQGDEQGHKQDCADAPSIQW